jgi:hypothetical protein
MVGINAEPPTKTTMLSIEGRTVTSDTNCSKYSRAWELKQKKNCYWQQVLLTHKPAEAEGLFVHHQQRAIQGLATNSTWLSNPSKMWFPDSMARAFISLGARIVYMKRANLLDRLVCAVRDCFLAGLGPHYPVFSDGSRAELCFSRRHSTETTLAYFPDVHSVVADVREYERQNEAEERRVRSLWTRSDSSVETVTYEALSAFEYGDMQTSASEWFRLLRSLGVVFRSVASVAAALEMTLYANSRPPPGTQAHVIYNWMAVRDAVRATHDPGLIGMLRD